MIPEHSVRFRLAHAIRTSVRAGEITTRQWADIIRHVTGSVVPVMDMGEGTAQKVLDFIEIERRIMAWDGWHEGPILGNRFPFKGTPTGRFSSSSVTRPQHLASRPAAGVASVAVVNPNEEH